MTPLTLETALSVAMLASFLWAVRYLVPRAVREQDAMAVTCAVLTAVVAFLAWLLIGVGTL